MSTQRPRKRLKECFKEWKGRAKAWFWDFFRRRSLAPQHEAKHDERPNQRKDQELFSSPSLSDKALVIAPALEEPHALAEADSPPQQRECPSPRPSSLPEFTASIEELPLVQQKNGDEDLPESGRSSPLQRHGGSVDDSPKPLADGVSVCLSTVSTSSSPLNVYGGVTESHGALSESSLLATSHLADECGPPALVHVPLLEQDDDDSCPTLSVSIWKPTFAHNQMMHMKGTSHMASRFHALQDNAADSHPPPDDNVKVAKAGNVVLGPNFGIINQNFDVHLLPPQDSDHSAIGSSGPSVVSEISDNIVATPNYGRITQVSEDDSNWLHWLPQILKISQTASYADILRTKCTPGTRIWIMNAILEWARDTSPTCASLFCLLGPGGTGKSTIAFTIANLLDNSTVHPTSLGGSFFCSRHSRQTRIACLIIRTLVFQLALVSPSFRVALKIYGDFEKVDEELWSQFEALLVVPWMQSSARRRANGEPCYMILIDAIEELDPAGGIEFLESLLKVLELYNLSGLKFLVTSRPIPELVLRIQDFYPTRAIRLEQMPLEESNAAIKLYLQDNLDRAIANDDALVDEIVAKAGGLFIYAATIVDYLRGGRQEGMLRQLLATSWPSHIHGKIMTLDSLYRHILECSLVDPPDEEDPQARIRCLAILHTFLCTSEPVSALVAVQLLTTGAADNSWPIQLTDADDLIRRLSPLLYIQNGRVKWYHRTFLDFMLDKQRSGPFHCHLQEYRRLANSRFGIKGPKL